MQHNELHSFLHCFLQGGTIIVKTVLDNPDVCKGAILSAPSLQVDPNVVGPVKVSSTTSAMNALTLSNSHSESKLPVLTSH